MSISQSVVHIPSLFTILYVVCVCVCVCVVCVVCVSCVSCVQSQTWRCSWRTRRSTCDAISRAPTSTHADALPATWCGRCASHSRPRSYRTSRASFRTCSWYTSFCSLSICFSLLSLSICFSALFGYAFALLPLDMPFALLLERLLRLEYDYVFGEYAYYMFLRSS